MILYWLGGVGGCFFSACFFDTLRRNWRRRLLIEHGLISNAIVVSRWLVHTVMWLQDRLLVNHRLGMGVNHHRLTMEHYRLVGVNNRWLGVNKGWLGVNNLLILGRLDHMDLLHATGMDWVHGACSGAAPRY